MKRREQMKPNALNEDQCELQRSEDNDGKHDVLEPNVKFASLKEQVLFYGDTPDDDPIYYHNTEEEQGSPEELADSIEGMTTSAEKILHVSGWCKKFAIVGDRVQECFQAQAERRSSCECEARSHQAAQRCRTRANVSSQVRSAAAEV
jgi:hypothetical protein